MDREFISPVRPSKKREFEISPPLTKKSKSEERQKRKKPFVFKAPGRKQELKYFTKELTGYLPNTLSVFHVPLTSITSGSGDSERIGDQITVKSIQISLSWAVDPATIPFDVQGSLNFRWLLVLDTQSNGAYPAIADILENSLSEEYSAMPVVSNAERFRILKDVKQVVTASAHNGINWNWPRGRIEYYRKLNIPIQYNGPIGDYTQIVSNNLFMIGVQSGSNTAFLYDGFTRVRYQDCSRR